MFQAVLACQEDLRLGTPRDQGAHQEGGEGPGTGREADPQL